LKTLNISLPEALDEFVQQKVATGGYGSASEVVREGLRLLQQYDDERLRTLRAAIRKGMESGEGRLLEEITTDDIVRRGTERLHQTQASGYSSFRSRTRTFGTTSPWTPEAATRTVEAILARLRVLASFPGREDMYPGLRWWPKNNYVVFYGAEHAEIRVSRILHGHRDIQRVFDEGR